MLSLTLFFGFACEEAALDPQPESNNIAVYEEFWRIFNEKYAMFDFKNVDWQNAYNTTRPLIDNSISSDSLISVMGSMVLTLRDGHTSLIDREGLIGATFDIEEGFPVNLNEEIIAAQYLRGNEKTLGGFTYTILPDNIGYIIFRDFLAEITDEQVDQILTELKDTQGIIIDVRGNGGGDPFGAGKLASHFTTQAIYAGYERFKTGPGKDDFRNSDFTLQPSSGVIYTKPVAVLTNRLCYSATTTFLYLMDPIPNVTFIGGKTGGGSGSVAGGQLINGWQYSLSVSEFIDARGRHLDDGVDPDILVNLDEMNTAQDEIIERAIEEIKN